MNEKSGGIFVGIDFSCADDGQSGNPFYLCADGIATAGGIQGPHSWNIVRPDGQWCFVDVTWDDTEKDGVYGYDYFAVSKAKTDRNHQLYSEKEAFCNFLMNGGLDRAVRNFGR